MYKNCKIILLPTEKSSIYLEEGILHYNPDTMHIPVRPRPYNIYVLSDDEIKEDDYVIVNNKIVKAIKNCGTICYESFDGKSLLYFRPKHKKIIATNDKSLWIHDDSVPFPKTKPALPQISQEFIKMYINEYNKGNKIKNVTVEYNQCLAEGCNGSGTIAYPIAGEFDCTDCGGTGEELKISPDNTIYIE